uniref:Calcium-dependent protein kinase 1 n=1 Tax=Nephromyces sp. MMRI TaxID=2496275 RepID=A0A3Q8UC54_9APIC|nr:calcium-dependent protein kinase [Nephromyces sp. MMRI]
MGNKPPKVFKGPENENRIRPQIIRGNATVVGDEESSVLQSPFASNKSAHEGRYFAKSNNSTNHKNYTSMSCESFSKSNFIVEQHIRCLTDDYTLDDKKLGQGTYGSVCAGKNNGTGMMRAIKTISKEHVKNVDKFQREIAIMKSLDHPNIIKLHEVYEDRNNIYLVMELCEGGELFDLIIANGHFSEVDACVLMKQLFSAICYLHAKNIMHRDLKPENFLLLNRSRDSPMKIIDFGLSCRFKAGVPSTTKAGTPYYVSPQVLKGNYDHTCDYWSSGVIMYILLCGYPPFYGETDAEILDKVRAGSFHFIGPEWRGISEEAKDLIRKLLNKNPKQRCTAEQALQHEWVEKMSRNHTFTGEIPDNLISNLKGYTSLNKLKKAALTIIAQHLSETEIHNLRDVFIAMDSDHNGTLSVKEFQEGLKRFGWDEVLSDLDKILKDVNSDKSGEINYTEFLAASMDTRLYIREDICREAFRIFDLDADGKISQQELLQFLGEKSIGGIIGKDGIDALMQQVDLDGDGKIDFEEFMHMMKLKPEGVAVT